MGLIKFEGVCLVTDSTWSFFHCLNINTPTFLLGVKSIVSDRRNKLAHYEVLHFTALIFSVTSGLRALNLDCKITSDVQVCVCIFVRLLSQSFFLSESCLTLSIKLYGLSYLSLLSVQF